jgi:pyridoxine kinase
MAKVLSISSQVIYGHVGNSTASFVLQRAGHEVLSLPTVLLSNRPGYSALAGDRIAPAKLDAMLEAALVNGWLTEVDAILTGYIPTAEHATLCERWIGRLKVLNPDTLYLCDPIIGDEPAGIYIEEAAASAIRGRLVPLAGILTPNCFELGWLAGRPIPDAAAAVTAARGLTRPAVIVTSAPADAPDRIANILVEESETAATASARATVRAHGTGDFFAAIFLAHKLNGLSNRGALQAAAAAMTMILAASQGQSELALIETQARWAGAGLAPAELVPLPGLGPVP